MSEASPATIAQALAWAKQQGLDRLDAQLLLANLFKADRVWLLAHDDQPLDAIQRSNFLDQVGARLQDIPLAYLLGEKEFCGLMLQVSPAVLVPRPDTEVLVAWALEILRGMAVESAPQVIDLGTGSGAIALAVKHAAPWVVMHMADLSDEALTLANANAKRLKLEVNAHLGSWWEAVPRLSFDLVLSNPPYIAGGDPHLPALRHEPQLALTPGGDGLSSLQIIVTGAAAHMREGAWLLLEHGYDQAEAVHQMLAAAGFESIQCRTDLGHQPRVSGGRRGA